MATPPCLRKNASPSLTLTLTLNPTLPNPNPSPLVSGEPPAPRRGHCCVVVADKLLICGGYLGLGGDPREVGDAAFTTSLHILDTRLWQWSQPTIYGEGLTLTLTRHRIADT